jgi:hypothetical protein
MKRPPSTPWAAVTFSAWVKNSIASLLSGDDGAVALVDEGEHLSNKVP